MFGRIGSAVAVMIERLRRRDDRAVYLRCGGCRELRHKKLLDALHVDLGDSLASRGAAFVLVYFCRGREVCENKAREHFAHWLDGKGLFVAGEAQPPKCQ